MSENNKVRNSRWIILVAALLCNFCVSLCNVYSIFIRPLAEAKGIEITSVSMGFAYCNAMLVVSGIVMSRLVDKIGIRKMMYMGVVLMAGGFFLLGRASSPLEVYLSYGGLWGLGCGCVYNFSITNTIRWFPERKGLISGFLLASGSLGQVVLGVPLNSIIDRLGIEMALYVVAGGIVLLLAPIVWVVRKPDGQPEVLEEGYSLETQGREYTWREMVRQPSFYLLFFFFLLANAAGMTIVTSASVIFQTEIGLDAQSAAIAVSIVSFLNFGGRVLFGLLSDKIGCYRTLGLSTALSCLSMAVLYSVSEAGIFLMGAYLTGVCAGALFAVIPVAVNVIFGQKNSGTNYSLILAASVGGSYAASRLNGYYYTSSGSYRGAFAWGAVMDIAAFVLLLLLALVNQSKRKDQIYSKNK